MLRLATPKRWSEQLFRLENKGISHYVKENNISRLLTKIAKLLLLGVIGTELPSKNISVLKTNISKVCSIY